MPLPLTSSKEFLRLALIAAMDESVRVGHEGPWRTDWRAAPAYPLFSYADAGGRMEALFVLSTRLAGWDDAVLMTSFADFAAVVGSDGVPLAAAKRPGMDGTPSWMEPAPDRSAIVRQGRWARGFCKAAARLGVPPLLSASGDVSLSAHERLELRLFEDAIKEEDGTGRSIPIQEILDELFGGEALRARVGAGCAALSKPCGEDGWITDCAFALPLFGIEPELPPDPPAPRLSKEAERALAKADEGARLLIRCLEAQDEAKRDPDVWIFERNTISTLSKNGLVHPAESGDGLGRDGFVRTGGKASLRLLFGEAAGGANP